MSKGKVLMAMSGGIDSTMASLLLHEEGYEVIGLTMKTWDYASCMYFSLEFTSLFINMEDSSSLSSLHSIKNLRIIIIIGA